jgi:hypothetical protein
MTAKEKAVEMMAFFDEMHHDAKRDIFLSFDHLTIEERKYCICTAIDEIDKAIDFDWMEVQNIEAQHRYWQEVKQEIQNIK